LYGQVCEEDTLSAHIFHTTPEIEEGLRWLNTHLKMLGSKRYRLEKTSTIRQVPTEAIRLWLHREAIYHYPTQEVINWLHQYHVVPRHTIEIGAGRGLLAMNLNIPATDSKLQDRPHIQAHYRSIGQPLISYPSWVEEIEALEAIDKYQPKVVIGSWITHKWQKGDTSGNMFGVDELALMRKPSVEKYVFFGDCNVHRNNLLLQETKRYDVRSYKHRPPIVSRGTSPCVWVIKKRGTGLRPPQNNRGKARTLAKVIRRRIKSKRR